MKRDSVESKVIKSGGYLDLGIRDFPCYERFRAILKDAEDGC
jgi:hypothetical protein